MEGMDSMDTRRSRKAAAVALVALAVLGIRAASAAGVGAGPQELFVGNETAEQCSSSAVTVDYDVAYDAALSGYGITAAHLSGLDERCLGYDVIVSLNGSGGTRLAELTAVVDGEEMRVEVPAATPVSAEHLAGVAVVLKSAEA